MLGEFLLDKGMPTDVADIRREHVEAYIADVLTKWKSATAHNRCRSLHSFFNWLTDEGEATASPMARLKRPTIPEESPDVLSEDDIRKMLKVCAGKGFEELRDTAIVLLSMEMSRSNSASAPKTWKISLPPEVVVSICSVSDRNPIPRSLSFVITSIRYFSERPSRSRRHVVTRSGRGIGLYPHWHHCCTTV
jgi:hypothetical protein